MMGCLVTLFLTCYTYLLASKKLMILDWNNNSRSKIPSCHWNTLLRLRIMVTHWEIFRFYFDLLLTNIYFLALRISCASSLVSWAPTWTNLRWPNCMWAQFKRFPVWKQKELLAQCYLKWHIVLSQNGYTWLCSCEWKAEEYNVFLKINLNYLHPFTSSFCLFIFLLSLSKAR